MYEVVWQKADSPHINQYIILYMDTFIGIDLGTTYSAVSTIDQYGKPVILKNKRGESLTPSVIYFGNGGEVIAGADAKELQLNGEENIAAFFKRNMGNKDFFLTFYGRRYTSTDLSAILLAKLKEDAEAALGKPVRKAVVTVPAYFNDLQRNETIIAAQQAGLEVLRIINEPTAAAILYGSNKSNQKLLVYDLGGGTFDVTVLEITDQSIRVLSTGGDHQLGGKDWDDRLLAYIAEQFINEFGIDPLEDDIESYNELAFKAENVKKNLSNLLHDTFTVSYKGNRGKYHISREKFEELTQSLLHSTTSMSQEVLNDACLTWAEMDGVLLVGGSTKMPMVVNWVKQMTGKDPLRGVNVDVAVCLGAAMQAQIECQQIGGTQPKLSLSGKKTIVDVMGHSLGNIAHNHDHTKYINAIIIKKNLPVPSAETRPFTFHTHAGKSNELDIYLTQGETPDVEKCIVVGKYIFHDIEHVAKGKTIIDIEYRYDANGAIHISGLQRETGRKLTAQKCSLPDDMSWLYRKPEFTIPHLSVVMAIDISGSMKGKPLEKAMEAAQRFVDRMDLSNASVGLVAFSDAEKVLCPLTQNTKEISNSIKQIKKEYDKWGGGTDAKPLDLCYQLLSSRESPRYIIVLTDGEWGKKKEAIQRKQICVQEEIDIIAIGFGSVDKKFLEAIATSTENAVLTNLDELVKNFGNIAQVLVEGGSGLKLK